MNFRKDLRTLIPRDWAWQQNSFLKSKIGSIDEPSERVLNVLIFKISYMSLVWTRKFFLKNSWINSSFVRARVWRTKVELEWKSAGLLCFRSLWSPWDLMPRCMWHAPRGSAWYLNLLCRTGPSDVPVWFYLHMYRIWVWQDRTKERTSSYNLFLRNRAVMRESWSET